MISYRIRSFTIHISVDEYSKWGHRFFELLSDGDHIANSRLEFNVMKFFFRNETAISHVQSC